MQLTPLSIVDLKWWQSRVGSPDKKLETDQTAQIELQRTLGRKGRGQEFSLIHFPKDFLKLNSTIYSQMFLPYSTPSSASKPFAKVQLFFPHFFIYEE